MSAAKSKGLGKGLGALLQNYDPISDEVKASVVELKLNNISPNADQPRKALISIGWRNLRHQFGKMVLFSP